MTTEQHAEIIRSAIEAALVDGCDIHIDSRGYPDPTEERLAVSKIGEPDGIAWHWMYEWTD